MSEQHIRQIQALVGAKQDGVPGPMTVAAVAAVVNERDDLRQRLRAVDDTMPATVPTGSSELAAVRPPVSLGELALDYCLHEAGRWGVAQVSVERVAEYFSGCTRDGKPLAFLSAETRAGRLHSFCAAAQGFAEDRCSQDPAMPRPPWRAGALEIMKDAQQGLRPNERWAPLSEFWDSSANKFHGPPPPGSIAVYQNRLDATRGHVERVIDANQLGYRSVGANENDRRWIVDRSPVDWRKVEKTDGVQRLYLLGFVVSAEFVL